MAFTLFSRQIATNSILQIRFRSKMYMLGRIIALGLLCVVEIMT